jgi:NAD(P)-dependent dehydrogenase (short-subunit alcohol dehydrogenase family)
MALPGTQRSSVLTGEEKKEFAGKNALITGGARNIGFEIAKELALRGASVALADIAHDLPTIPYPLSTSQRLEKAAEDLASFGTRALGLVCDIRNEVQVQSTVNRIVDQWGGIDILVNNAGVISLYPIAELSQEAWDVVVDVCLKGAYLCSKYVLPHMIASHYGKIINIASVAGLRGLGLSTHYCAAKHGLLGFTKALAMEVASYDIHVNAVCPGTVESTSLEGIAAQTGLDGEPYRHFSQGHLFQDRRITPEDIARAVRWLASEDSRCVTGTVLSVDAGWSARG